MTIHCSSPGNVLRMADLGRSADSKLGKSCVRPQSEPMYVCSRFAVRASVMLAEVVGIGSPFAWVRQRLLRKLLQESSPRG